MLLSPCCKPIRVQHHNSFLALQLEVAASIPLLSGCHEQVVSMTDTSNVVIPCQKENAELLADPKSGDDKDVDVGKSQAAHNVEGRPCSASLCMSC